ncbi:hypothetical protein BGY98DRAFT_578029 [Russula aff. rugulosa BPL654]|nr:hypothetical protein BGY98DRAFT_578029 [Russula aff. rugulosa BPL654]
MAEADIVNGTFKCPTVWCVFRHAASLFNAPYYRTRSRCHSSSSPSDKNVPSPLSLYPSPQLDIIFNRALDTYKKRTKQDLVSHPLYSRLEDCKSPDAILTILREFTEFSQSQNTDVRFTKWLAPTVNVLYISSAILGEGLTFCPGKAIFVGVGVLLLAAGNMRARRDTLIRIFTRIEGFFTRLEIYTSIPPTPAMTSKMADIMVEVISLLGFATKEIKQCRIKTYLKVLIGNTDVQDALQRLNDLTEEEAGIARAELRRTTHNLGEGVQGVGRGVEGIADRVQHIHDNVGSVDEGVQDVLDRVQDVEVGLRGVSHRVQNISHNVLSVRDRVDCADLITFETGSHLRIRPQITTFCGRLISGEQPTGSHAALFSKTGNPLVLSCGYTEIRARARAYYAPQS